VENKTVEMVVKDLLLADNRKKMYFIMYEFVHRGHLLTVISHCYDDDLLLFTERVIVSAAAHDDHSLTQLAYVSKQFEESSQTFLSKQLHFAHADNYDETATCRQMSECGVINRLSSSCLTMRTVQTARGVARNLLRRGQKTGFSQLISSYDWAGHAPMSPLTTPLLTVIAWLPCDNDHS